MVFQDGEFYLDRDGKNPALNVIDNLIAQKKIVCFRQSSVTWVPDYY
jgi:hypothetical protein